jgi:hypothetical protein
MREQRSRDFPEPDKPLKTIQEHMTANGSQEALTPRTAKRSSERKERARRNIDSLI